jgi:hypothetical protein
MIHARLVVPADAQFLARDLPLTSARTSVPSLVTLLTSICEPDVSRIDLKRPRIPGMMSET